MFKMETEVLARRGNQPQRTHHLSDAHLEKSAKLELADSRAMLLLTDGDKARATVRDASTQASVLKNASGYSGIEENSKPFHNLMEHLMTFIFPVMFGMVLYFSAGRLYELNLTWLIVLAVPVGWTLGDLVTGVVHWAADNYANEDTPVIGHSLVKPFRLHHIYPRDICTHNLISTIGNTCILAVPLMTLCLYVLWSGVVSGVGTLVVFTITVMTGVTVATNQFHKWAHQENTSPLVRWLQQARIILEPAHHELHHTDQFDKNYCITNGWLNPVLEKVKFFCNLEYVLRKIGIEASASRR